MLANPHPGRTGTVRRAAESGAARPIAVFDIDWTLLCKTSAESLLFRYLRRKKLIPLRNILRMLCVALLRLPTGLFHALVENKYYLHGMEIAEIRSLMPDFYTSFLEPALSKTLMEEMRVLKERGYAVFLVSGTLDFIVNHLIRTLELTGGAGADMQIRDGRITGRLIGRYPIDRGKIARLKILLKGMRVDWDKSTAYADSCFDIPLLSLFGRSVAVHPDAVLRREAERRGWRIIHREPGFNHPVSRIWADRFYREPTAPATKDARE